MIPRFSIPTRIFLAFTISFAAFVALLIASVLEHERTTRSLRLIEEGYVPLALTVSEAKATQSLFATLLDRFLDEEDPTATRHWLNTARRLRPTTVRRALYNVDRAFRLKPEPKDSAALERVRAELQTVQATYEASDKRYDELFATLVRGRKSDAQALVGALQNDERTVRDRLRRARDVLEQRLSSFSATVAERERRTTVWLVALTVLALFIAVAATWWSQRVLAPIPQLIERVAAVARGDLETRIEARHRNDELGRLAAEFERMVEALAQRDAHLREAHEEQLRTRARLLQSERLAAIGRVAAHVTHEVRNPLSSIRLNVELLEEDLSQVSGETKGILAAIHQEIDRLTGITEEYLRLARVPQPKLEPDDLVDVVESVVSFVRPEMKDAGVELFISKPTTVPDVALDEPQIRQVFINLLRNAREAMEAGGKVWIAFDLLSDGVEVTVRDSGPGVPDAQRAQIFDVFFTTKDHGSGLGLPLTQQIVQAHGGRIDCERAPEGGAMFRLWFPIAKLAVGDTTWTERADA